MICPFIFFLLAICAASARAAAAEAPASVVKTTGVYGDLRVDFYERTDGMAKPMVVVVHGFMRSKRNMAGWGADLAAHGMVVAVPTLPTRANHARNADAIAHLVQLGRAGQWKVESRTTGKVGLVGFSMGGLVTFLAAATLSPSVDAWVGLDPVDFQQMGANNAGAVQLPALALLAEPSPCNQHGNARAMLRRYAGPLRIIKIDGASHCDPEWPTSVLAQLVCGRVSEARQKRFRDETRAFLVESLAGLPASADQPSRDYPRRPL